MQEILKFNNVDKTYYSRRHLFSQEKIQTHALKDINFSLNKGETLGIVGESGSGKSTLAKILLRIETVSSGSVDYFLNGSYKSLNDLSPVEVDQFKSEVQLVFQDPYSSLNPMKRIIDSMNIALNKYVEGKESRLDIIKEQILRVNLPEEVLYKYPHELSGGQKQRINLARVLSLNPKVIVFDEATSSLDVSVQASVINLIKKFKLN